MAMKALIVAAFFGAVACGPTISSAGQTGYVRPKLGAEECTYGPSYWCDHIRKAAQCGATSWCVSKVWRYMELPEDNDDICQICQDMVKQARDQLNSNETQEELKEVLEGSCNLIPVHIIAEECDTLVDEFIPELIEVLTSELNPQVVCQTAGLCNSPRVDKLLLDFNQKKPADTCTTCQRRTEVLVQHVSDGGQQQLLDTLLPICRDFGSYSDACSADLAANIGTLHQLLQQVDSEGICLLGNACPGLFGEQPVQLQTSGPSVDCDLCIHIVKHWRDILVANTTKEEFKEILDGICAKTKAWAPKCTQLVNEYYLIIYNYLVHDIRAYTICKAIGICASEKQPPVWPVVVADSDAAAVLQSPAGQHRPLIRLQLPVVNAVRLTRPEPESEPEPEPESQPEAGSPVKSVTGLHHVQLKKSPPRAYGNDGLVQINPLDVSAVSRLQLPFLHHLLSRNTELCDLCEFGLRELQKQLMKDATEEEITTLVEDMCQYLPTPLTSRCHQFVEEYGSFVITLLAQEIDPTQVCPALRLCPLPSELSLADGADAEPSLADAELVAVDTATPGCAICEYAMNTLLNELKDKKTEREIRDGLDRLCEALLPHTVAHECQELVNTFSEELIDMIAAGLTADQICITLHLCAPGRPAVNDVESNSIRAVPLSGLQYAGFSVPLDGLPVNSPWMAERMQQDVTSPPEQPLHQSPVCVLCEFVMMQVKVELSDNATVAEVEAALRRVCLRMPRAVADDCAAFVDNYAPAILDAIRAAVADPDSVCEEIQLCHAAIAPSTDP